MIKCTYMLEIQLYLRTVLAVSVHWNAAKEPCIIFVFTIKEVDL